MNLILEGGNPMNSHDWEHFGEDIRRTIQEAVEYGNYDRLNQTITDTVNQAVDWVNQNVKGNRREFYEQTTYKQATYEQPVYKQSYQVQPKSRLFSINTSTKVSSILFMVFGYLLGVPLLLYLLFLLATILIFRTGEVISGGLILFIPGVLLFGGCAYMALKGTKDQLRIGRFNKYKKEIGSAELCNITKLAALIGKPDKYVVKDIEKMIEKKWFTQGHLDKQKTCLMVTDNIYNQYQQLEDRKEKLRIEEEMKAKERQATAQAQAASRQGLSPEVQKVVEQGDEYVRKIRACNDAIPGEEISAKIERIEIIVDKIFDRVEQNPASVSDIRKLMDYYLPTTVKLLEAYAQMDAQPVGGENIQTAKREIEATLDTLNIAFEKLLDSLFQKEAWDVSADISVLNTMLAQEGLKEDGLKK